MTKKEFMLQTMISMAANPKFTFEDEDEDGTYSCLSINEIFANAESFAIWLEEEEGVVFDEEGN